VAEQNVYQEPKMKNRMGMLMWVFEFKEAKYFIITLISLMVIEISKEYQYVAEDKSANSQ
jgi:hypothetical protein